MEKGFTISEIAELTGMSIHALRFYEREGLIPRHIRREASSRHRRYTQADLEWFRICCSLRQSGMSLAVLRQYTQLVQAGPGNEMERLRLLKAHQCRVDEQMAALKGAQDLINYKVGIYEKRLKAGTAGELWT